MKPPSIKRYLKYNPHAPQSDIILQEEANYFARCLLMPEDKVKELWEAINADIAFFRFSSRKIKEMSIIFAVPNDEMKYRLKELGLL